jgi:hypothetical protein
MNPALGLAAARVVIGGVALAAPEQAARLFRLDPVSNPQLPYFTRLFGGREVALGAAVLLAGGSTRRNLILAGAAVDVADAAAGYLAGEEGSVDRTTSAFLAGPAVVAVLAGLLGLRGATA